jgi:hypothetical protein
MIAVFFMLYPPARYRQTTRLPKVWFQEATRQELVHVNWFVPFREPEFLERFLIYGRKPVDAERVGNKN